jgi:hypothetical protein
MNVTKRCPLYVLTECVLMRTVGIKSSIARSIAVYVHIVSNYKNNVMMDCQDVATLPTPCLLIDHAVIDIGVCGNSCYVGLLISFASGL